jgi:serine/threonine-protein kinase
MSVMHHDDGDEADTLWSSMVTSRRPIDLAEHELQGERYQRVRVLGVGGMGEVALVRDHRIGREIALKTVRGDIASPEVRSAFIAEARMQAQLEHPSIIPVYDIGVDAGGREYFTMRAIAGTTLSKILARLREHDPATVGEFSTLRLLEVFRRLCLVIEYTHGKGVIHRDLKPGNVMLGEYGEIHVLDWGLAQRHGDPDHASDPSAPVLGTPGYIAPEQTFHGSEVDLRVDVYALGAILFEILALRPLHAGRDTNEKLQSTRRKHSVTAQQRAPEREIPPELDAACARATAYSPAHRYASVAELRGDIDKFLEGHRNLELRRELAARHAGNAEHETRQALAGGSDAEVHRRRALQDVARSLALDPDNTIARQSLVRLIAEPPETPPGEVSAEIAAGTYEEGRFAARLGAIAYFLFAGVAMITLLQGVRSWTGLGVVVGTVTAAGLWCIRGMRRYRPREFIPVFLLSSIAITVATGFYGPLVMVPLLAAANLMAFNFAAVRNIRALVFVIGTLVFLVPAGAEWLGLVDPFYTVEAGRIVIAPRFIDFDETMVRIALMLVNIAAITAPTIVVWKLADSKDELRRKYVLQSWQLRQLVS